MPALASQSRVPMTTTIKAANLPYFFMLDLLKYSVYPETRESPSGWIKAWTQVGRGNFPESDMACVCVFAKSGSDRSGHECTRIKPIVCSIVASMHSRL